jgi:hypothetical protein
LRWRATCRFDREFALRAVEGMDGRLAPKIVGKDALAPVAELCLLVGIEPILINESSLGLFWRPAGPDKAAETIGVVDQLLLGHGVTFVHGPPDGLVLTPMELKEPR